MTRSLPLISIRRALVSRFTDLELEQTEGVLTNRAVAYIKLKKYKEALSDCEQALNLNPNFGKAHLRASTCYIQIGELKKAMQAIENVIKLGDASGEQIKLWIQELIK